MLARRRRKRRARPVLLGELLGAQARRWRFVHLHRLELVRRRWAEAVGEYVARHAVPTRLVRKVLRVAVEDSSWANELSYLTETMLLKLRELLPGDWVREIQIVQGRLPRDERRPESTAPSLAPATEAMRSEARELGAQAGAHPELAAAIERARLASLRRLDAGAPDTVEQAHEENPR
ncbi:MAG: DUF721 domain-containing protein [Deltaproteobacteria bacterium]|nr:DUF721 domain-containing protein [Deltaproteobacteria bacterium]